ncbi:MAG: hypothetical protein NZ578_01265 [Candidatus Binatia bacterium]|nr:hypothetical protein [Candidatus Binatia bacterium]
MPPLDVPPSPFMLVVSLFLLVVGIGIAGCVLFLLGAAFLHAFGGVFERAAFQRCRLRCHRGDALLEQGDFARAVELFGAAFFLQPIRYDPTLLSDISNYHTGLLSRLLTVADEMGKGRARLPSLADVDRLLAVRFDLHLDCFRARKRGDEARLHDSLQRLRENERQVRQAVARLIEEIRTSEERVLYH